MPYQSALILYPHLPVVCSCKLTAAHEGIFLKTFTTFSYNMCLKSNECTTGYQTLGDEHELLKWKF